MSSRPEDSEARQSDALEKEARKRVRALRGFYQHLASYVIVNGMLVLMNLLTSPGEFWAVWPLFGWGIGLLSHTVQVFGVFGMGSREWEERKIREYVLARQSGLSAAEVKKLMQDELRTQNVTVPSAAEWERMRQRLEHLEAIVTAEDWDRSRQAPLASVLDGLEDDEPGTEEKGAGLGRRVRG